jgi:hypothetical protein
MTLTQVAAVAADAQGALFILNVAARNMGAIEPIVAQREVHRSRLMVCAEYFAAAAPANDVAFESTPELA